MVGPYGDWIKHDLEGSTVLVSECDGVRLISSEKHELLSRVPDSLVDVFKIGSTAPGAFQAAAQYCCSIMMSAAQGSLLCCCRTTIWHLPCPALPCPFHWIHMFAI